MIIVRQSCDTRKMEGSELDVGNAEFGGVEALTVSDHMFIPNDRIFLNGETDFTEMMVARFAGYHRRNYSGYKAVSYTHLDVYKRQPYWSPVSQTKPLIM